MPNTNQRTPYQPGLQVIYIRDPKDFSRPPTEAIITGMHKDKGYVAIRLVTAYASDKESLPAGSKIITNASHLLPDERKSVKRPHLEDKL